MLKCFDYGIEIHTLEELYEYDFSGLGWSNLKDIYIYCLIEYGRAMRKKDVESREFWRLSKNYMKKKYEDRKAYFDTHVDKKEYLIRKYKELGLYDIFVKHGLI
jgi:hypothetical protein